MENNSSRQSSAATRSFTVLYAVVRSTWILLNNLVAVPTYLVWMLLLRPMLWHPDLVAPYWWIEGILYKWMFQQVSYWSYHAGYHIVEVGDELSSMAEDQAVLMFNHQSTADVPVLMGLLSDKGFIAPRLCWIMDVLFKFTQFGAVSSVHGDFFIQQGKETRHLQSAFLDRHLREKFTSRGHRWVVIFPEGGFLRKRRAASKEYGRKNGYPILEHVTLPRIGALQTILTTLGAAKHPTNGTTVNGNPASQEHINKSSGVKWLVDGTIAYPRGKPLDLFCILFGHREPCRTVVHYKKHLVADIPTDTEELTKWVYARYEEKNTLLDEYYASGSFPVVAAGAEQNGLSRREPRMLRMSTWWAWTLQTMFLASSILHCYLIAYIVNSLCSLISVFV